MMTLIKPPEERPIVKCELNFLNTIYEQEDFRPKRKIPFLIK